MSGARTIMPPSGAYADVTPLAKVMTSGTTWLRSEPNQWPSRPKPQMTSSAQSRMPYSSHMRRSSCQ